MQRVQGAAHRERASAVIISSMRRRRLLVLARGTASLPATTLVHQPAIAGCRPLLIRPPGGLNAQQRRSVRAPPHHAPQARAWPLLRPPRH